MSTPHFHPGVPNLQQRQEMWGSVSFPPIAAPFPAVEHFVETLRPLYANGKVEHAAFALPEHPVFRWFAVRNQYHEMGFFEQFWKAAGPKERFVHAPNDLNFFDQKYFSFCSPFQLGGGLAWILSSGGAYRHFERGGVEAKRLGEEAALDMLAGDYDDTLAYHCGMAWSDFFFDVAWDHTFLVLNPKKRIVHALLATDTD